MELEIRNISKHYKDKKAVNDVSLTLTPGVWGLLGANGAGKTSLMRMIAGIVKPTSGEIFYDGLPIQMLKEKYREAFADSKTGMAPVLMEIDLDAVDHYYEKADLRLKSLMKMEQPEHISAQKAAIAMYDKAKKPFQYYSGITPDAMDYQVLLTYLIMILCVVIVAPIFTSDYQTGADDILRCTKYGRGKMAVCKILSSLFICGGAFLLCLYLPKRRVQFPHWQQRWYSVYCRY